MTNQPINGTFALTGLSMTPDWAKPGECPCKFAKFTRHSVRVR
ncbi:hypothetical protein [Laspinema palackyanum]